MKKVMTLLWKSVKYILRIICAICILACFIAFLIIPFMSNYINPTFAQWIWYPSLAVIIAVAIYDCVGKKNPIFKNADVMHLVKFSYPICLFAFISVFVFSYYQIDEIWHWVIFGFVFLYMPVFLIAIMPHEVIEHSHLKEKQGNAYGNLAYQICIYWLYDMFYMSIFNHWMMAEYIFGFIIVVLVLMDLIRSFLSNHISPWIPLAVNLILSIVLSIYLIYNIPESYVGLKDIVTTMIAAVYGGVLTLVGVAWTIKDSNNERRKEEIAKNKPVIFIADPETQTISDKSNRKLLKIFDDRENLSDTCRQYKIDHIVFYNGDYSYSSLFGIIINETFFPFEIGQVLNKNTFTIVEIDGIIKFDQEIKNIYIVLQDMMDNIYQLEVNFEFQKDVYHHENTIIHLISGIEMKQAKQ